MIKLDLTTIEVETLAMSLTMNDADAVQRTFVNACISDDCLTERTCNPVNC